MNQIYSYINFIFAVFTIILCVLSYRNRKEKGAIPFLWAMIFLFVWVVAEAMELQTDTLQGKVLWRNIAQIGMALIPITNVWFVLDYADVKRKKLIKMIIAISIVINAVALILIFTNPYHHLMRQNVALQMVDSDLTLFVYPTLLGEILVIFRFVLSFFAAILLLRFQIKTFKNMRRQVITIWIGYVITIIFILLKNYWLKNIGIIMPISTGFIILYTFIAFGIFKYEFLSISPIAKDWVINSLSEGIVVASKNGQVLEANPAAKAFFEQNIDFHIKNENISKEKNTIHLLDEYNKIMIEYEKWIDALKQPYDQIFDIKINTLEGDKYFNINVHHMTNSKAKSNGSVSVIRDVTEDKARNKQLVKLAELDGLTQVYNRQTFIEKVNTCKNKNVSMLVIDIDNFKKINDTYGHPFGDKVIIALMQAVKSNIRKSDLIGRIGGEEFCVMLANCDTNLCRIISNRILKTAREATLENEWKKICFTVSIGAIANVALKSRNFETMFEQADKALYEAKNTGKNRVVVYEKN